MLAFTGAVRWVLEPEGQTFGDCSPVHASNLEGSITEAFPADDSAGHQHRRCSPLSRHSQRDSVSDDTVSEQDRGEVVEDDDWDSGRSDLGSAVSVDVDAGTPWVKWRSHPEAIDDGDTCSEAKCGEPSCWPRLLWKVLSWHQGTWRLRRLWDVDLPNSQISCQTTLCTTHQLRNSSWMKYCLGAI